MTQTPKQLFSALADAVRNENPDSISTAVDDVIAFFGVTLPVEPDELRGVMTIGNREEVADAFIDLLQNTEGFHGGRFKSRAAFEYPTTARRSFVDLAEAIRTVNDGRGLRNMLVAIAGLHITESERQTVLVTFLANFPHRVDFSPVHRQNLAESLARLLDGKEKFDGARFIYHATSNSSSDDDSESGKWSFNRNKPEAAQKTTIEAVTDEGDATETVVL